MKYKIEQLNFTKKSLLPALVIYLGEIISTIGTFGFKTEYDTMVSCIMLGIFTMFWLGYNVIVFSLYHKLPKNKNVNDVGVVFLIDTHNNKDDYNSIRMKICEQFEKLTNGNVHSLKINPIILSFRQVETFKKKIATEEQQAKFISKCNCVFGIFLQAYDEGRNTGNIYQLQMHAAILHPELDEAIHKILKNNFNYVFRDLSINKLDRNNDLEQLQNFGTKLFYICHLIFAAANEYSGYVEYAIKSYQDILKKVESSNKKFYVELTRILYFEICACSIILFGKQCKRFLESGQYDARLMLDVQEQFHSAMIKTKNEKMIINYYLQKAIYSLLVDKNIQEAKGAISILDKRYKRYKPNLRQWAYSDAFLFACEAKPSQFKLIKQRYSNLRHNVSQDVKLIFDFINSYIDNVESKTSIKLALFWLVFYREDLSKDLISEDFIISIKEELLELNDSALLNEFNNAIIILSQRKEIT